MRGKNFYFSVLERIKLGKNLAQIARDLDISKQRLNYYVATLKRHGCIKKIGYGCWQFIKYLDLKEVKKTAVIGQTDSGTFQTLKPGKVRGHGFLMNLRLRENLRNWERREEIFKQLGITYKPYYVGGIVRGQTIVFRKRKVHLTRKSIVVNFEESFINDDARKVRKDLVYDYLRFVKALEATLRADFKINGQYFFKVSRQHYALIKNALAKQYDKENKRLEVYNHRGLWFVIDNSFNLHEAETIHKDKAVEDNLKVQNFFNSLEEKPITTHDIYKNFSEIRQMIRETSELQIQQSQVMHKNALDIQKLLKQKI